MYTGKQSLVKSYTETSHITTEHMKFVAVIPARYNSKRFPGKVLQILGDHPIVYWVYQSVKNSSIFEDIIVATDSDEVASCVKDFGGIAVFTSAQNMTGSDRVAEIARQCSLDVDVVANIQCDQPFVTTKMLELLVSPYTRGELPNMATLACPLDIDCEYHDPNVVKVICNNKGNAIYFSRSPIPYYRHVVSVPVYHHLGLYAFQREFLEIYSKLDPSSLEICEGLEQLRVIENGYSITVSLTEEKMIEINIPSDLEKAKMYI